MESQQTGGGHGELACVPASAQACHANRPPSTHALKDAPASWPTTNFDRRPPPPPSHPSHPSPAQICVATFDSTIHFYSMRPGQSQPHMLVVPDVTDVYCPLPGNVVVPLREARPLVGGLGWWEAPEGCQSAVVRAAWHADSVFMGDAFRRRRRRRPPSPPPPPPHVTQVEALLDSIPRMFAGSQVAESCGGAALRSAVEALSGGEGGRLHAFLCGLPRRGALHLRLRDVGRPPTDRDTLDSLLPENKEYAALAAAAATAQVSIDLFLLAQVSPGCAPRIMPFSCAITTRSCAGRRTRTSSRVTMGMTSRAVPAPAAPLPYLCNTPTCVAPRPSLPPHPCPQGYVDVATLGVLCSATAGSLYHWPAWSPQLDADEFFNDLRWAAMRPQVARREGGRGDAACLPADALPAGFAALPA